MTLNQCQPGIRERSDDRSGVEVSGIHRLVLIPGSMPVKPSRATPTIWYVVRSSVNTRPTTCGSLPNRLRPEAVAEHGDGAAASQIVVGRNDHAPESRRHPEHAKTISGDELSVHSFLSACRVECGHARRLVAESGQLGAPPHRIDETGEERIVERRALRAAAFEHADRDQRRRLADGQRPEDQGIDQRERRRAAADRQCQRGDRGQ